MLNAARVCKVQPRKKIEREIPRGQKTERWVYAGGFIDGCRLRRARPARWPAASPRLCRVWSSRASWRARHHIPASTSRGGCFRPTPPVAAPSICTWSRQQRRRRQQVGAPASSGRRGRRHWPASAAAAARAATQQPRRWRGRQSRPRHPRQWRRRACPTTVAASPWACCCLSCCWSQVLCGWSRVSGAHQHHFWHTTRKENGSHVQVDAVANRAATSSDDHCTDLSESCAYQLLTVSGDS